MTNGNITINVSQGIPIVNWGKDFFKVNVPLISDSVQGKVLYENEVGTKDNISLSETVANFKCIEICFHNTYYNFHSSIKIYSANGKYAVLQTSHVFSKSGTVITDSRRVAISGTSISGISGDEEDYGYYSSYNNSITKENRIAITKVIGYI